MPMNTKIISSRFALAVAAGLAAASLHAQGTISASATLTETGTSGSEDEYSLVLNNTGNVDINAFWYGWIQGHFDLPSPPTSIVAPSGWSGTDDGNSVQFANNTGAAIAAGDFATFTFDDTADLSAMTTGTTGGTATGNSIAYATVTAMNNFEQNVAAVATGPFAPTQAVPEPSSVALLAVGSFAFLAARCLTRRRFPLPSDIFSGIFRWIQLGATTPSIHPPTPITQPPLHVHDGQDPHALRLLQVNNSKGKLLRQSPPRGRIEPEKSVRLAPNPQQQPFDFVPKTAAQFGRRRGVLLDGLGVFLARGRMKKVRLHRPRILRMPAEISSPAIP